MLGSAELVEMAEAKLHGKAVSLKSCVGFFVRGCECRNLRIPVCWAAPTSPITGRAVKGIARRYAGGFRCGYRRRTAAAGTWSARCKICWCEYRFLYGDNERDWTTFTRFTPLWVLKRSKNWRCSTVLSKRDGWTFFKKGVVNVWELPIMRLHWHGTTAQAAGLAGFRDERQQRKKNNRLTLKWGKRNIRDLATVSWKPRCNCSLTIYQTICVGTQSDMDS